MSTEIVKKSKIKISVVKKESIVDTNLSPLSSHKNRRVKGVNIDYEQIIEHKKRLTQYIEENNLEKEELTTYLEKYDQYLISLGETP